MPKTACRHIVQQACQNYGVPLISCGVNISVEQDEEGRPRITDQSGEVIVIRHGDGFCLHCLGRIDPIKVAAESHPDPEVREGLVTRGYVQGMDVKEPAVMPLNAVIAAQAVQALIDQYREGAPYVPVTVYESHEGGRMYADWESMAALPKYCFSCGRDVSDVSEEGQGEDALGEMPAAGPEEDEADEGLSGFGAEDILPGEELAPAEGGAGEEIAAPAAEERTGG